MFGICSSSLTRSQLDSKVFLPVYHQAFQFSSLKIDSLILIVYP